MTGKKRLGVVAALILSVFFALLFFDNRNAVPVLNYHQINDTEKNSLTVNTEQFAAQMKYLHDAGYTTITMTDMLNAWDNGAPLPDRPVIITFDDGYMDNYRHAFPILKQYGHKATVFIVTDYVNTYPNYITWDNAREMLQSGVIDIGSHTLSHQDLTRLQSEEEIRFQLFGSRQAIAWHLKKDADFLAYPAGRFSEKIAALTQEAGYKAAFTVHYGLTAPNEPRFAMSRIPVFGSNTHTLLRFKLRLWFAPIIEPLNDLKLSLISAGYQNAARIIFIP